MLPQISFPKLFKSWIRPLLSLARARTLRERKDTVSRTSFNFRLCRNNTKRSRATFFREDTMCNINCRYNFNLIQWKCSVTRTRTIWWRPDYQSQPTVWSAEVLRGKLGGARHGTQWLRRFRPFLLTRTNTWKLLQTGFVWFTEVADPAEGGGESAIFYGPVNTVQCSDEAVFRRSDGINSSLCFV